MYLEHFGLATFPFSTSPDPRFYYPTAKHREALACLLYAVAQRKGFALITGEVGAGKSMVCRTAMAKFGDAVDAALVAHTLLGPREFFQAICAEFALPAKGSKIDCIGQLRQFLHDRHAAGSNVVLIVDEAQNLSRAVLEEVRMLGNLETATEKLLQIILVGQPELRRLIGTRQMRQLDQRITIKFHLGSLSAEDAGAYIDHRMRVAGAQNGGLFTPEAKQEVFRASGGIPRVMNVLCDQALLQSYVHDAAGVSLATMQRVIADREGYYMDRSEGTSGVRI